MLRLLSHFERSEIVGQPLARRLSGRPTLGRGDSSFATDALYGGKVSVSGALVAFTFPDRHPPDQQFGCEQEQPEHRDNDPRPRAGSDRRTGLLPRRPREVSIRAASDRDRVATTPQLRPLHLPRREAAKVESPRCDALSGGGYSAGMLLTGAQHIGCGEAPRPVERRDGRECLALRAGQALPAEDSRANQTRAQQEQRGRLRRRREVRGGEGEVDLLHFLEPRQRRRSSLP